MNRNIQGYSLSALMNVHFFQNYIDNEKRDIDIKTRTWDQQSTTLAHNSPLSEIFFQMYIRAVRPGENFSKSILTMFYGSENASGSKFIKNKIAINEPSKSRTFCQKPSMQLLKILWSQEWQNFYNLTTQRVLWPKMANLGGFSFNFFLDNAYLLSWSQVQF